MKAQRSSYVAFGFLCLFLLLGSTEPSTDCTGITGGGAANLRVENHSPYTMTGLYISPSTSSSWGSNWLTYPLEGNTYIDFSVAAGTYDILAHWNEFNGTDQTEYGVVLNAGESYVWAAYLKSAVAGTSSQLTSPSLWQQIGQWLGAITK